MSYIGAKNIEGTPYIERLFVSQRCVLVCALSLSLSLHRLSFFHSHGEIEGAERASVSGRKEVQTAVGSSQYVSENMR